MIAPQMSLQGRADKTIDKMRRGGLPAPTEHTVTLMIGDGAPCDGCGETIQPREGRSRVTTLGGAFQWRFHDGCYDAWATFKHEGPVQLPASPP